MNLTNIILWTFSLTLAVIGISFGTIASVNSSKANKKIQDLISSTFIAKESQKFLFDNIKNIITANRKTIAALEKKISYADYSLVASHTRLHILSKSIINFLKETEFKEVTESYLEIKESLDKKFSSIINIKDLSTNKVVPVQIRNNLKEYHQLVITSSTQIIKAYTATINYTTGNNLKK